MQDSLNMTFSDHSNKIQITQVMVFYDQTKVFGAVWDNPLEDIKKGWKGFKQFITFKVGDASSIRFWQDSWSGGLSLRDNFPELFHNAVIRMLLWRALSFVGDSYHLDVRFVCPVQDRDLESIANFTDLIYTGQIRRGRINTLAALHLHGMFLKSNHVIKCCT